MFMFTLSSNTPKLKDFPKKSCALGSLSVEYSMRELRLIFFGLIGVFTRREGKGKEKFRTENFFQQFSTFHADEFQQTHFNSLFLIRSDVN